MSLAEYFNEMQATSNQAEAHYVALTQEAEAPLAAVSFDPPGGWDPDVAVAGEQLLLAITDEALFTEQAADADRLIFAGLQDMLNQILSRIEAIEPPDKAVDSHSEMIAAATDWAEVVTDITDALVRAESAQQLVGLLTPLDLDNRFEAIHLRFSGACLALQAVADLDDEANFRFSGPWLGAQSPDEDATAAFACGED